MGSRKDLTTMEGYDRKEGESLQDLFARRDEMRKKADLQYEKDQEVLPGVAEKIAGSIAKKPSDAKTPKYNPVSGPVANPMEMINKPLPTFQMPLNQFGCGGKVKKYADGGFESTEPYIKSNLEKRWEAYDRRSDDDILLTEIMRDLNAGDNRDLFPELHVLDDSKLDKALERKKDMPESDKDLARLIARLKHTQNVADDSIGSKNAIKRLKKEIIENVETPNYENGGVSRNDDFFKDRNGQQLKKRMVKTKSSDGSEQIKEEQYVDLNGDGKISKKEKEVQKQAKGYQQGGMVQGQPVPQGMPPQMPPQQMAPQQQPPQSAPMPGGQPPADPVNPDLVQQYLDMKDDKYSPEAEGDEFSYESRQRFEDELAKQELIDSLAAGGADEIVGPEFADGGKVEDKEEGLLDLLKKAVMYSPARERIKKAKPEPYLNKEKIKQFVKEERFQDGGISVPTIPLRYEDELEEVDEPKPLPFRMSEQGLQKLLKDEQFRESVYDDGAGNKTIGYGTLWKEGMPEKVSEEEALEMLKKHDTLQRMQKIIPEDMSSDEVDTFMNIAYNAGPGNSQKLLDSYLRSKEEGVGAIRDYGKTVTGNLEKKHGKPFTGLTTRYNELADVLEKNRQEDIKAKGAYLYGAPKKSSDPVEAAPVEEKAIPASTKSKDEKPLTEKELLMRQYKDLLSQYDERHKKFAEEKKKTDWLNAVTSIAESLDKFGRSPRGYKAQKFTPTGGDTLKQKTDILQKLISLQPKEMSKYQREYLDAFKASVEGKKLSSDENRILREQKEAQRQKEKKIDIKLKANENIYKVTKDFEGNKLKQELDKQGISFEQADNLVGQIKAGNELALGAVGTKMARAMGEVGVLTDADVVRYIQSQSILRKSADQIKRTGVGSLPESTLKDMQSIIDKMKKGFRTKEEDIFKKYINRAYENFGKQAGYKMDDIIKMFGMDYKLSKPKSDAPYGDTVEKNGKKYRWNPVKKKYQLDI